MKSHTAALAAISAAVAIGASALPSGAAAWQRCLAGSQSRQYCEPPPHHHHHHHRHHRRYGSSGGYNTHRLGGR